MLPSYFRNVRKSRFHVHFQASEAQNKIQLFPKYLWANAMTQLWHRPTQLWHRPTQNLV